MSNIRLKSGIRFFFKRKWSNYSRARVLYIFLIQCVYFPIWELFFSACKNSHIDILHSTSVVAVQLTCQFALTCRRKWHRVPVGDKEMCLLAGNLENLSDAEAKPPYMDSEILKTKLRTPVPELFHLFVPKSTECYWDVNLILCLCFIAFIWPKIYCPNLGKYFSYVGGRQRSHLLTLPSAWVWSAEFQQDSETGWYMPA